MPAKTVVITGVTGFIGGALAAALAGRGDLVRGLSRSQRDPKPGEPVAEWFRWAGGSAPIPAAALEGADAVVHLAAESVVGRWNSDKKRRIKASRVDGTQRVVEAIHAAGEGRPPTLISASAIGYYGDAADTDLTEESPSPDNDFLAEVCRDWEAAAVAAEADGVRVVRLRIGLVLHPDGGALQAMLRPFKLGLGGRMGSGRQWQSWIHRDDLVQLILFAIDNDGVVGPLNGTAPQPVVQIDFAKALGKALRRPAFVPAPAFALRAALGEFAVELLSSKKVLPAAALRLGYEFAFPKLGEALADLLR